MERNALIIMFILGANLLLVFLNNYNENKRLKRENITIKENVVKYEKKIMDKVENLDNVYVSRNELNQTINENNMKLKDDKSREHIVIAKPKLVANKINKSFDLFVDEVVKEDRKSVV